MLRLHPPVPKQLKMAVADDVLPDGTKVTAGTAIVYSAYAMGRDPNNFEDPLTLNPERWLNSDKQAISNFKNVVFNAGPRLCLGKPLAYMESKLVVAMLLCLFDFELAAPCDDSYTNTLVLPMKNGISVKVKHRRSVV